MTTETDDTDASPCENGDCDHERSYCDELVQDVHEQAARRISDADTRVTDLRSRLEASEAARAKAEGERDRAEAANDGLNAQMSGIEGVRYRLTRAEARLAATTGEVERLRTALGVCRETFERLRRSAANPMRSWDSGDVVCAHRVDEDAEEALEAIAAALAPPAVVPPPQPMKEPSR